MQRRYLFAAKNTRVNCVAAGSISTPLLRDLWPEDVRKDFVHSVIAQKRLSEPEEVARMVLFLACDESSHLTGTVIPVDGRMNAKNP